MFIAVPRDFHLPSGMDFRIRFGVPLYRPWPTSSKGSARLPTREYVSFLNVASGSATESCYLLSLAGRLGLLAESEAARLTSGYGELCAGLRAMIQALHDAPDLKRPKP
jgi:hypothetical protein